MKFYKNVTAEKKGYLLMGCNSKHAEKKKIICWMDIERTDKTRVPETHWVVLMGVDLHYPERISVARTQSHTDAHGLKRIGCISIKVKL